MKPHICRFVLPVLAAGLLQAQVHAPQAGVVRYTDGSVRTVYGVPGSFVVGPIWSADAIAISFSDQAGLIAEPGAIRLLSAAGAEIGKYTTRESAPVLSVEGSAQTAIVWLPEQEAILRWNGTSFERFTLAQGAIPGPVVSLSALGKNEAELLISQNGTAARITISLGEESTILSVDAVPGVSGSVLSFGPLLLLRDEDGITLESPNGLRHVWALPPDVVAEHMSSHWLHLQSRGTKQDWALELDLAHPDLLLLPAAPAATASSGAIR